MHVASPRSWIGWGLLAPLALGCVLTARGAEVTDLRLASTPDGARLEVGLSGNARPAVFTLDHPARVVVDLKPASLDRHAVMLPAPVGPVRSVRSGPRPAGGLRLVLELDHALSARVAN